MGGGWLRRVVAVGLSCGLSAAVLAQQAGEPPPVSPGDAGQAAADAGDGQEQQPTFRVDVDFVRVDVIVTDRQGTPVTDLAAEDFEVFEDNRPQAIESFRLVHLGEADDDRLPRDIRTTYDEETEAAREDVRLIAIFLDDYHVRRINSMGVREPLIRFIQNDLSPSDLIALMYPLMPLGEVVFTRDHQAIIRAIEQFEGRKYDYEPRNQFEEGYAYRPASVVERIRNEVSLSALKGLAVRLGGLREGRKAIVLVSEGYSNALPPQLRDPVAALPGIQNPNRYNPGAGENDPREDAMQFFSESELQSELREVYDTANRHNASIYALDPRGLTAFEFDINDSVGLQMDRRFLDSMTNTLRILAEETDGRAIVARNDLDRGLQQLARDSSSYYLLGYTTDTPSDGRFHRIAVRIPGRPDLQVRARPGYWAATAEEAARAIEPPREGPPAAVTAALAAIAEPPGAARLVRTWVGTARAEDGRTRVTFVWEPAPIPAGVPREAPARVSVMAIGGAGTPYFRGRVPDVGLASAAAPQATGGGATGSESARVVFDVDPGPLSLRLSVEGGAGEVIDTDAREVQAPDFSAPDVSLSTPAVLRGRTAREHQEIAASPDAVPTAAREFRRTERMLVRFEVYGPGGSVPPAAARLLNRDGGTMLELDVVAAPTGRHGFQADVPLAALAPGDYLIEVAAGAGATMATEYLAFRVSS